MECSSCYRAGLIFATAEGLIQQWVSGKGGRGIHDSRPRGYPGGPPSLSKSRAGLAHATNPHPDVVGNATNTPNSWGQEKPFGAKRTRHATPRRRKDHQGGRSAIPSRSVAISLSEMLGTAHGRTPEVGGG